MGEGVREREREREREKVTNSEKAVGGHART